ncbi:unnamed protein product [Paramecium octaurelia]|uniref:Uncharacterized protein n=1 Tax=Paramecium octaurelia TaxID=43137 RepID=A0A8S1TP90_PAROT|nr:unnamed protein product [Paramecium octaurelia]
MGFVNIQLSQKILIFVIKFFVLQTLLSYSQHIDINILNKIRLSQSRNYLNKKYDEESLDSEQFQEIHSKIGIKEDGNNLLLMDLFRWYCLIFTQILCFEKRHY